MCAAYADNASVDPGEQPADEGDVSNVPERSVQDSARWEVGELS
jgi:hypothetical protein